MVSAFGKKHFWHFLIFTFGGLFLLGSYVVIGEPAPEEAVEIGPLAAIAAIIFGVYLFFQGEKLLASGKEWIEYYDAVVMAVGIALVVRTFVVEPFKIPSGSMIPTLLVGDYLFVKKYAYGYRVPFTRMRIFLGEGPARGDVAVFEYPTDPSKDYIKRIVGLPGDRIAYDNKRLLVNGEPVSYLPQGPYDYQDERGTRFSAGRFMERLDGKEHSILIQNAPFFTQRAEWVVPEGRYFVLGDNRDNSNDSRFWGYVPDYRLVGKAVMLFWSWDGYAGGVRWDRLGDSVI